MISVIIPAYNEEKRITKTVLAIEKCLLETTENFEILVVNDGSTDETKKVVSKLENSHIRLLSYQHNKGKGGAVKHGIKYAAGNYIVFTDADLPYPPENIQKACQLLKEDCDVVLGSRFQTENGKRYPWYRTIVSKGFGLLTSLTLNLKEKDTQCGFKAFRYSAAQTIFDKVTLCGWGFDVEIIFVAQKHGLKIKRLPVELFHENNISKINVFKDSVKMAKEVFEIKHNEQKGMYQ